MKTIKFIVTMLIVALSTIQVNAQLKVETSGDVTILNSKNLFFDGINKYLGFPTGKTDFSLINKTSGWMRIGSVGGIAFWGETGAETNNSYKMFVNSIGVGIGGGMAWDSSTPLAVFGNAYVSGGVYIGSDIRFKKNIQPLKGALTKVMKLNGKSYEYNTEEFKKYNFSKESNIGFIAQELKEVLPEAVHQNEEGFYIVNYDMVIPLLVEGIKEQQIQIEEQQTQIAELRDKLNESGLSSTSIINLDNLSTASLSQNAPNPFNEKTEIKYFIPKNSKQASIYIYNMNGVQIKEVKLIDKGKSSITISGSEFEAGMYLYVLIVDSKELDTKRMILTK